MDVSVDIGRNVLVVVGDGKFFVVTFAFVPGCHGEWVLQSRGDASTSPGVPFNEDALRWTLIASYVQDTVVPSLAHASMEERKHELKLTLDGRRNGTKPLLCCKRFKKDWTLSDTL